MPKTTARESFAPTLPPTKMKLALEMFQTTTATYTSILATLSLKLHTAIRYKYMMGRLLHDTFTSGYDVFSVPASGVYIVNLQGLASYKVVVIK